MWWMRKKDLFQDIPTLAGVNFFSTLNPVLWCGVTAWELARFFPDIFNRQANFVVVTALLFVLPMIFAAGASSIFRTLP